MSTPRWFKNVNDLLDAARAHGFIVKKAQTGHWQVWQDMTGLGNNRLLGTFGGTGMAIHGVIAKRNVANIKRQTGVDIRLPPPPRPKPSNGHDQELKVIEPKTQPERDVPRDTFSQPVDFRAVLREELGRMFAQMAALLLPRDEEHVEPPEFHDKMGEPLPSDSRLVQEVKPPLVLPTPAPLIRSGKMKRKVYLREPEQKQVAEFYAAGFEAPDIARAFNINFTTVYKIIKKYGVPLTYGKGRPKKKSVDTL